MSTTAAVLLICVVGVAAIGIVFAMRQRSLRLQRRFGPEYSRAVQETGSKYRAEAKLDKLEKRVKKFEIHPLRDPERLRYRSAWKAIQGRFVDDPALSLRQADEIVREVMGSCGYPLTTFEDQAAQLSVDHPLVVENYRAGHLVAVRQARNEASTEEIRQALIYYRALFDDLVGEPIVATAATAGRRA
jgi:hypothetical protein